ncbi:SDR family NAD(P)-dependent oxidoreductase [Sulfitobacter sp. D35]|uniref:SDR family NAD(P)-dependent oxidoreductase n=1 Tax=Sulfitobacter sp. D35 TaxID=3083252 RepID=UPI00296F3910|nr:SDR family NAD(P)-dependent oxidoreductase [Sulfitobacter sp. D35]MDW4500543.1 SDR family NAD(P)-dependent oxidoreductase [Sulfitobacter sp. D35]
MTEKSILITGCSSGIGRDAALELKRRGWRVFAACRKETDCAAMRDLGLESPRLDYEDPATIEAAVSSVLEATGGTLDALFNNGAYAIPGPVEDIPADAMRAIFEANLIGWHDLTVRLIPVMRRQGHGRIVNCSSVLGFVHAPWRGAYVATKFALEGLTATLRLEMRGTGIEVVLIEPGPIATEFRSNAIGQFERWVDWKSSARRTEYEAQLLDKLYKRGAGDRFEKSASAVTARLIEALEARHPKPQYFVTVPTHAAGFLRRILPARLLDRLVRNG